MSTTNLQDELNKWRGNYETFAAENLYIINKDAEIVPFVFNRMQRRVFKLLLVCMQRGIPIRIICIKDRQVGFTTLMAGYFYYLTTLFPNRNCLIASHDIDSAAGIFNKVKLFYKKSRPDLRPLRKISNRRELYFANPDESGELGLESRIVIDTADSKELGVSYTIQFALLSELAIWESMGLDIKQRLVALHQAIPERAGTGIIIETTPRGEGYVSNMWFDPNNGYEKIFISSVADDQYRIDLDPSQYFILEDYPEHRYGDETLEYEFYESEVKIWYPEINLKTAEGMRELHHEVMSRLAWRRDTIDKKCEGDKEIFDREYPISVEKAFANSGSKIFPQKILSDIKKYNQKFPAIVTYYKYDNTFDDFANQNGGHLKVFQEPHPDFKYVIGGDVGQGVKGGDCSSLVARRLPDLKQVFTFNDVLDSFNFSKIIFRLAKLYNGAFLGIETNEKGGYATVEYLINKWHYVNLYMREVMGEINAPKTKKYGWVTSKFTKPTMIADLSEALLNGLEILDQEELKQLLAYQLIIISDKFGDVKSLTGVIHGKDDLAIAEMICLQMTKYVSLYKKEEKKQFRYTLDWWAQQVDKSGIDYIGNTPKGPNDGIF